MTDALSLIPQSNFIRHGVGKFAPKLSEEDRCAILALIKSRVRRDRIAAAFGIDRRTVGHIANPQSPRYKDVRDKYKAEGHDEFIAKYITEEVALRIAALTDDTAPQQEVERSSSPRANRLAGEHKVKPPQCSFEHRIEIRYRKEISGEGWYYRDMDGPDPDAWYHNGDASRKTSQACYDAAVENLLD